MLGRNMQYVADLRQRADLTGVFLCQPHNLMIYLPPHMQQLKEIDDE